MSKHINNFKPGDTITQSTPMIFADELNMSGTMMDGSFIGKKLIYCGIANGCIYIKIDNPMYDAFQVNSPIGVPLHKWSEVWDHWTDPDKLLKVKVKKKDFTLSEFEVQIREALNKEDYKVAAILRDKRDAKFGKPNEGNDTNGVG